VQVFVISSFITVLGMESVINLGVVKFVG